ncbi:MAG: translation initiation factor IF-2 [Candidatus Margulisiibacteriota bacterium]|nr:translation initiation factor IF-2 [Candidatus Margulisiibacteriota bacterium]
MKKVKVGTLAKELGIASKELIKMLKDLGVEVKTAASSIDEESAKVVREVVKPSEEKVEAPRQSSGQVEVIEEVVEEPIKEEKKIEAPKGPVIETDDISVKDLSEKIKVKPSELIKALMMKGIMANINQRINAETAKEIAGNLGKDITIKKSSFAKVSEGKVKVKAENLKHRSPIVTVMGHVDHGKTKLLDAIRKTRVAEGEAGGITQHIGAYQVKVHGKDVTFLDTPGHEAFTTMRARGARVTDIAILVVAADDGVKPQTLEAIDHAKAAKVPIIVAINKIDREESNPDRVKQQLSELELVPEDWGGKTVMVHTSALKGEGVNDLLEMILLVAEMQELKADPDGTVSGVVIESRLDKGRGPVASVLIQNGTIKIGDVFNIGATYGKVRALFNDKGERMKKAGPSTPVEVLGCVEVPGAGDTLRVVSSEKVAREMAEQKLETKKKRLSGKVLSLEDFSKHVKEGEKKDLALILKADVQGSIDAISQSVTGLVIENIHINIIHHAVGPITESDIMLARASSAIVIGFHVGFEGSAEAVAQKEGIEVRRYNIIYKLIEDVKLAMEGLLEPEYEEVVVGHAEVRSIFKSSKVGVIAGSFVKDGKLVRGGMVRISRGADQVFEGKLESLKRFKDDVKSVDQSFECGVVIPSFPGFRKGDSIEAYEIREKRRGKSEQGRASK